MKTVGIIFLVFLSLALPLVGLKASGGNTFSKPIENRTLIYSEIDTKQKSGAKGNNQTADVRVDFVLETTEMLVLFLTENYCQSFSYYTEVPLTKSKLLEIETEIFEELESIIHELLENNIFETEIPQTEMSLPTGIEKLIDDFADCLGRILF